MPCDTVSTARIKLDSPNIDRALLKQAAVSLFGESGFTLASDGTLTVNANTEKSVGWVINPEGAKVALTKEYSKAVVFSQAKRFGWQVKQLPNGKLEVIKGKF